MSVEGYMRSMPSNLHCGQYGYVESGVCVITDVVVHPDGDGVVAAEVKGEAFAVAMANAMPINETEIIIF